jgi:hypothetical protein
VIKKNSKIHTCLSTPMFSPSETDAISHTLGTGTSAENSFTTNQRRCCNCSKILSFGAYFRCSKCQVFVYCDKECQAKHWKKEHKSTCKQQSAVPPTRSECIPDKDDSEDPNLDVPYKYIVIKPMQNFKHKSEMFAAVVGSNEETGLELVRELDSETVDSPEVQLLRDGFQTRHNWKSIITSVVPGYGSRYDGFTLTAAHDENYQNR